MSRRAPIQASDCQTYLAASWPRESARIAFTVAAIGVCVAKTCNQSGMVSICTKMELAKTRGKTQMKPETCAVSTSLTDMPIAAETQEKAKPKSKVRRIPRANSGM